jgi:uncharacterized membrane protein
MDFCNRPDLRRSPAMISHRGTSCLRGAAALLFALALVGAGAGWRGVAALAQDAQTPAPADAQPPAMPAPDPAYRPGFFDAVGRWFDESRGKFGSQMKDANEKMLELHNKAQENAKEAAGAIVRWPNTRVMAGRERCELAANGGPDCRTAAAVLCRGKGFQEGKPFDTQSEENCPARVVLSGRPPAARECKIETFVMRAVCQ